MSKHNGTLLDGEYVEQRKTFYIFDIMFYDGKDITYMDFTKRLELLKKFKIKHDKIIIQPKNFIDPSDFKSFGKAAEKVYNEKYPYQIDGLILTPKNTNYRGRVYKWKPPEETTTDFFIKVYDEISTHFCIRLYSAISNKDLAKYKFNDKIREEVKSDNVKKILGITKPLDKDSLIPIPFYIPNKEFEDKFSYAKIKKGWNKCNKAKDLDSKIVELSYWYSDKSMKNKEWEPFRIRTDKTKELQENLKEGLFRGPNYIRVAQVNYLYLINPITKEKLFAS